VPRSAGAFPLACAVVCLVGRAAAAPLEACVAAYDAAQRLQQIGRLREAEVKAIACAQEACPAELRKDCLRWTEDIGRSTPTIVVHAVGAYACDLEEARVVVDGQLVADRLQGKAIPLDPGAHGVSVEAAGLAPIEERVVLSEGQKNRV